MGASQFLLAPSILLKLYTVYIGDRRYCGCQVVAMPASTVDADNRSELENDEMEEVPR